MDVRDRPWLDADLPVLERVRLLLMQMTAAEKVGQLVQVANIDAVGDADSLRQSRIGSSLAASGATAGNIRDKGVSARNVAEVQSIAVGQSRLGIPLLFARDVIHGHRTVFPIPLGQAASWDADLVQRAARIAATEASATGVRWTFAPMVDISHEPRWGRVAESFGEDPRLAGRLGAAAVRGFQGERLSDPTSVAACAKHFVGYGLAEGGRDYDEVNVGEIALRNRQMRPFRAALEAGCATVMSAFHTVDGVPMTANEHLLRGVLKQEWGFDGVVVSDWNAVEELLCHGVATDRREAAELALRAGVDVDMVSGAYGEFGAAALADGGWSVADLDDAVARVLALKFRLGLFDAVPDDAAAVLGWSVPIPAEHLKLAREAAAASFVLLANDGVLPLVAESLQRVLVTGPFADATGELFGTWTLDGRDDDVASFGTVLTALLPEGVVEVDSSGFSDRTLTRARGADVVIACVGEHPDRSGEANSVTSLNLPPGQEQLLAALGDLGVPLVVVVFAGRPLVLDAVASE
ncbi:MAG: glycoside hydrolase family 3 N-terminal domain-containing protein [Actinomycetes bacterium]